MEESTKWASQMSGTNKLLALLLGLLDLGEKGVGLAVESLLQDAASAAVNKLGELHIFNQVL